MISRNCLVFQATSCGIPIDAFQTLARFSYRLQTEKPNRHCSLSKQTEHTTVVKAMIQNLPHQMTRSHHETYKWYRFSGPVRTTEISARAPIAFSTPSDSLDWLAQFPEEGQGVTEDYVRFQTSRSEMLRPIANHKGNTIVLLRIVQGYEINALQILLDPLIDLTKSFFNRPCICINRSGLHKRRAGQRNQGILPRSPPSSLFSFLIVPDVRKTVVGRYDTTTKRSQHQVKHPF